MSNVLMFEELEQVEEMGFDLEDFGAGVGLGFCVSLVLYVAFAT